MEGRKSEAVPEDRLDSGLAAFDKHRPGTRVMHLEKLVLVLIDLLDHHVFDEDAMQSELYEEMRVYFKSICKGRHVDGAKYP